MTHSPGLSQPTVEKPRWPSLEHRGQWTVLDGWDAEDYEALRRTLIHFGLYAEHKQHACLWLFNSGLNLPLKPDETNDMALIVQAIQNYHDEMMLRWPAKDRKVILPGFTPESVAACYHQTLERILGVGA